MQEVFQEQVPNIQDERRDSADHREGREYC